MTTSAEADREAGFARLYRRYQPHILAYLRRRLPEADAVEAVGDVFLAAWRHWDSVPEQPLPWLYRIAGNSTANQRRRSSRWRRLQERLQSTTRQRHAPDLAVDAVGRDAFATAFAQLKVADREVLRLVAWEGLQGAELAEALGCSVSSAKVRVHRARRRLARLLGADQPDSTFTSTRSDLATEVSR
jgi:RNA polymerase sigma-70 factor (ECF subfamily)